MEVGAGCMSSIVCTYKVGGAVVPLLPVLVDHSHFVLHWQREDERNIYY